MTKSLIFTPQAQNDFDNSYYWYEEQQAGLSKEFARCVDAKLSELRRNPLLYPIIFKDTIRRALVSRFPYAIYYVEEPENITIIAILDQRRDPDHWKARA